MKRILVDVDGVIADLHTEWLHYYNIEYKDNLTIDKIVDWDMQKFVKPECGAKIFDYLYDPTLYDRVAPIDGAISSIRWLRQHGFDVRFVTSGVQPAKIQWLGDCGLLLGEHFMFSPDVVVAHDKSIIRADILIDDNVNNCNDFSGLSILFAQPWNSEHKTGHYRADNWPDVIQYIARKYAGDL
jgi:5'-nucleotidase